MDKPKPNMDNGAYLFGVVISNSARYLPPRQEGRKPVVAVTHEIALQPGVAVWNKYIEFDDPSVKVVGEEVTQFPKMKEFQRVELRLNRFRVDEGRRIIIQDADLLS